MSRSGSGVSGRKREWSGLVRTAKDGSEAWWKCHVTVALVWVNSSFICVASSGLQKIASHVIAFESPVPKLYHHLPPPVEDLDEVLAILFTRLCKPTEKEYVHTPLLVRRKNVANTLEWLKSNHSDHADLDISYEELNYYPENVPMVSIHYHPSLTNKVEEGTSVFDDTLDDGVEDRDCPFVVHGLTGDSLTTKSASTLKGLSLQHWNSNSSALAISHDKTLQSIYNNWNLYPQIFPWLFPYGFGGISSTKLSDKLHKCYLLMYHDKWFQRDVCFPFVAFSHHQIQSSTTGGYLLAKTQKFISIAECLLNINQDVLKNITQWMSNGEVVKPSTNDENECFQLIVTWQFHHALLPSFLTFWPIPTIPAFVHQLPIRTLTSVDLDDYSV